MRINGSLLCCWRGLVIEMLCIRYRRCTTQAQKFGVQKQLRKRFQRFLVTQGDYHNLLLTILRGMAREADRLAAMTAGGAYEPLGAVIVDQERFEERAQDYAITNVEAFYTSPLFLQNKFSVDDEHAQIVMAR
jgi:DNA replication licensing factor MCM2